VHELPSNSQGKTTQAALLALFDPLRPPAQLLERSGAVARWQLEVEARLPAFDGHFPEHPVLPGVLQLDWAERFAREAFGAALLPAFDGLDQLKFQQVIPPGLTVELRLELNAAGSELRFALTSRLGNHASGKLRFKAASA
jgi:3-hydroxymyristoyl/3-hydroxydecanoyl-(acyl carrier protein) dehydratase